MSFLAVTVPVSLVLGAVLVFWVVRRAREGDFEDWEGPAARLHFDDDSSPEYRSSRSRSNSPPGEGR